MERVKSGIKPLFIIERSDAATDDLTEDWTVTSTNGITLDGSILDYANHTDTLTISSDPTITLTNGAVFSPGNSIGKLNIDGNFTLGETAEVMRRNSSWRSAARPSKKTTSLMYRAI